MRSIILAAAVAAIAAPAFAADWSASPAQSSSKTGIVAGGVIFDCGTSGCHSVSDTSSSDPVEACSDLARQVGELSSFSDGSPFNDTRLSRCNAGAPKAKKS
jgi:hypothetical protein